MKNMDEKEIAVKLGRLIGICIGGGVGVFFLIRDVIL
jgi:hypothetical protein|tara:strand:- start:1958 stop:2068 length:111 start_codon:yes stop_codon:yes gene_type:complete